MQIEDLTTLYEKNRLLKTVTIEITNLCNWRCKHCYLDNQKIDIDLEKIFAIIDDARKLGAFELRLSGGEVTIYPKLPEIIKYAREKYMNVTLLSNMCLLPDELLNCINKYGISNIETTIFSLENKKHDAFVQYNGALKKTLKNIFTLKEMGVDILVKTWAIRSNFDELEAMKDYFYGHNIRFTVNVQIYSDIHSEMKLPAEEKLTPKQYCSALHLQDITTRRQLPLDNVLSNKLCKEYMTSIYITSSGNFIPCAKYRKKMGTIYETSLIDFWTNSIKLREVQNYCWNNCEGCSECNARPYCVRCGAMAYIKGKDYLTNCNETCLLAKIRMNNYEPIEKMEVY